MRLLREKFAVPKLPAGHIARRRLLAEIRPASGERLVALVAPAGYGKTQAAAQFAASLPRGRCAWVRLDESDAHADRLLSYVIGSLHESLPEIAGCGILGRAEEAPEWRELADELCFAVQEFVQSKSWLILDNWEHVGSDAGAQEVLARLIRDTPPLLNVLITGRRFSGRSLRTLEREGKVKVIGPESLRFVPEEIVELARAHGDTRLSTEQAGALWEQSGGWCVSAAMLVSGQMPQMPAIKRARKTRPASSMSAFRQYVKDECLGRLTTEELNLLVRLAPFELVDPNSLEVLDARPADRSDFGRQIADRGIPCTLEQEGAAVRIHPLIRECLLQEFRESVPQEEQLRIIRSAALRSESLEAPLDAARMLLAAGLHTEAVTMARRNWLAIIKQNRVAEAAELLARVPESSRLSPDFLSLWSSVLSVRGENKRLLSEVGGRLHPEHFKEYPGQYAVVWTRYRWAWLLYQTVPAYDLLRPEWQDVEDRLGLMHGRSASDAHLVLYMAAFAEHRGEAARHELDESRRLNDGESFDVTTNLSTDIAALWHHLGRSGEAQAQLRENLAECERRQAYTCTPLILANLTEILQSTGKLSQTVESADQAEAYMRVRGLDLGSAQAHMDRSAGHALWLKGDVKSGRERLTRSLTAAEGYSGLEHASVRSLASFLEAVPTGASAWSTGPEQPLAEVGEGALIARVHAVCWALSCSRLDWALEAHEQLHTLAVRSESRPWQATASILAAAISARQKDAPALDTHLRAGLDLLAAIDWNWFPLACEPLLAFVIWQAVRLDLHVDLVERLLAGEVRLDHAPHVKHLASSCALELAEADRLIEFATRNRVRGLDWTGLLPASLGAELSGRIRDYQDRHSGWDLPGLRIEFLGSDSVYAPRGRVAFARSKSKAAFQALLLAYPRALHEEQLIEMLWPESDPRRGRHILQVCINDIRKALDPDYQPRGLSYVRYEDECYQLELPGTTQVDFLQFQEAMGRMGAMPVDFDSPADAVGRLSEALRHYRGDLLPNNLYAEYTVAPRERLRSLYLKGCIDLASGLVALRQLEAACHYIERGLEVDPLWAEGVEALMRTQAAAGRIYRAVRVYRDYEARLRSDLDIYPDDSLRTLFAEILVGGSK